MNNTNTIALDTYTNRLAEINVARTEYDKIPLAKQRAVLAGPTQRLATLEQVEAHRAIIFGGPTHEAGMTLLEQIHHEIRINRPQSEKDAEEREQEEARRAEEKHLVAELNKIVVD